MNEENDRMLQEMDESEEKMPFWQPLIGLLKWKYLQWLAYGFFGLIAAYFLLDKVMMPLYTKHGREIHMPDVTNLPLEKAEKVLKESGFKPILDTLLYSMTYPKGYVISQNPEADAIVKSGRRTYLTVSKGEKWVRVPKLVGGSERDAILKLQQYELVPGERYYEFSSFYPKGVVSNQSIPAGDSVSVGDTVDIQISLGTIPENLTVPNLIGKSYEEAKKILLENGFMIGVVTYQTNNNLLPNTVIQQIPPAETIVEVGREVDLILSQIEQGNEQKFEEK